MQYMVANAVDWLPGTWYVQATNFPMWLKGDKLQPTFTYTALGEGRLLDEIRYRHRDNGTLETITGQDQFDRESDGFVWRGTGLLYVIRSRWRVLDVASDGRVAILVFGKTLFTAAGMDVISRVSDFDPFIEQYATGVLTAQKVMPKPPLQWLSWL